MVKHIILVVSMFCITLSCYAADSVAKVIKAQGDVSALNASNQKRTLIRGQDIFSQETVSTAPDSFATIRFTDGTVIDLAASSTYAIKDYNYNPADPKSDKFSAEIVEGGFRAITGSIGTRSPAAFSAKARMTTLTVRGTYFYLICPPCDLASKIHLRCDDVLQFTVNGLTAVEYQGKEFLLGQGAPNSTFKLENGTVVLSSKIPTSLPASYSTSLKDFQKAAASISQSVNETPVNPQDVPSAPNATGSGGGGSDPCGTLNAVGNALPNTKP